VNLLETAMFYSDACESVDDSVTDFVDYLYRKLAYLASRYIQFYVEAILLVWIIDNSGRQFAREENNLVRFTVKFVVSNSI